MRVIVHGVFILLSLLMLNACGPIYQTTYRYIPPNSELGRVCANQCSQTQQLCVQNCHNQETTCEIQARQQAQIEYQNYVTQHILEKRPIHKDAEDFYDPFMCGNEDSCNNACGINYRGCFTTCGGQVIPHTRCVAFCDQQ